MKGGTQACRYVWEYNSDEGNSRCKHPEAEIHLPKAQRKAVRLEQRV